MKQKKRFRNPVLIQIWENFCIGEQFITIAILFVFLIAQPVLSQPLAEGFDKFLGAGTNSDLSRYFDDYWNQVTPGNDGKWGSVETSQDNYNWAGLDKIYDFAVNGILF